MLEAADGLLVEVGFAAMTIEGIAARAGVGKQTIYRWWLSKADIFVNAFLDDAIQELVLPEGRDVGIDLRSHLSKLAEFLTRSDAGAVFRALTGLIQHDPRMADRFRLAYLVRQREIDRVPLRRAVERSELPADLDVELAVDQLVGPIYYRVLVTGEAVTRESTDLLVDRFLRSAGRRIASPPALGIWPQESVAASSESRRTLRAIWNRESEPWKSSSRRPIVGGALSHAFSERRRES